MLKPRHLEKCFTPFPFHPHSFCWDVSALSWGYCSILLLVSVSPLYLSSKIPSDLSSWNSSPCISSDVFKPPAYLHCSHNKTQIPLGYFPKSLPICVMELGWKTRIAVLTLNLGKSFASVSLRFLCCTLAKASQAQQLCAKYMQTISHKTHVGGISLQLFSPSLFHNVTILGAQLGAVLLISEVHHQPSFSST